MPRAHVWVFAVLQLAEEKTSLPNMRMKETEPRQKPGKGNQSLVTGVGPEEALEAKEELGEDQQMLKAEMEDLVSPRTTWARM